MDQIGRHILNFFGYSGDREMELRAFYDQSEVINGAIDGPVNQAVTALVRAKERRLGCK